MELISFMQHIRAELRKALQFIVGALQTVEQPWAFTGSLGMALQGVDLAIGDVDIQTTRRGAYEIQDCLAPFSVCEVRYVRSATIRSYLGTFRIAGLDVEVMGDVEKRLDDDTWIDSPHLPSRIQFVNFAGSTFPVLDLHYEKEAYRILGRMDRVAILEEFLQEHRPRTGNSG